MKTQTYINFAGNCEEAFKFYSKHLGAKVLSVFRWNQMPDAAKHTPPGFENAILHGRISLGETVLMAADVPGSAYRAVLTCPLRRQLRGGRKDLRSAYRGWRSVHAHGGDVFCLPLRPATRQVRHKLDDPPRASHTAERLRTSASSAGFPAFIEWMVDMTVPFLRRLRRCFGW